MHFVAYLQLLHCIGEQDAAAGKLDALASEALADFSVRVDSRALKHTASKRFWHCLDALPADVQALAHRSFSLLKADPSHPSLHFKAVNAGRFYSVRVGLYYRALGLAADGGIHGFWIGSHAEYDKLVG